MSSGDRVCFLLKGSIISVHLRTCDINLLNQWPIKQVKSRKILTLRPCQSGWSVLPSGAIVTSGSGLLLRTIPGSVVLPHLGSGSMAHAATKGHTGLACNLWPCWCSSTWPWLEPNWSEWPILPHVVLVWCGSINAGINTSLQHTSSLFFVEFWITRQFYFYFYCKF